jgi:hypothetical protein
MNTFELERSMNEFEAQKRRNPLLEKNLGDLVREMHALFAEDPNVIKPMADVPPESKRNYEAYNRIVDELNRRESDYTRIPISERRY